MERSAADKEAAFREAAIESDRKWERSYTAATKIIAQGQARVHSLEAELVDAKAELADAKALLQSAVKWPIGLRFQPSNHWHLKTLALLKSKEQVSKGDGDPT